MGIRIEDSVCVQEEHPLVLTTEAVKEVRPFRRSEVWVRLSHEVADSALGRRYRSTEGIR